MEKLSWELQYQSSLVVGDKYLQSNAQAQSSTTKMTGPTLLVSSYSRILISMWVSHFRGIFSRTCLSMQEIMNTVD